jgi:hypothetical protein
MKLPYNLKKIIQNKIHFERRVFSRFLFANCIRRHPTVAIKIRGGNLNLNTFFKLIICLISKKSFGVDLVILESGISEQS